MTHATKSWRSYSDAKPESPGIYRWRLASTAIDGLYVEFSCEFRSRGAGYQKVTSPQFDHWDGYRVHVPPCEWTEDWHEHGKRCEPHIAIIGLSLLPCPFCGEVPDWKGVHEAMDGGIYVCSHPHEFNVWWTKCCQWNHPPHLRDPRVIADHHNLVASAVAAHRKGATQE